MYVRCFTICCMCLTNVCVVSPFKSSLLEENQTIFQHPPALAPSAAWDEVERITKSALSNNLPVTQFDNLINVITETIFGACTQLIDRFWYLYIDSIAPYVMRHQDKIGKNIFIFIFFVHSLSSRLLTSVINNYSTAMARCYVPYQRPICSGPHEQTRRCDTSNCSNDICAPGLECIHQVP